MAITLCSRWWRRFSVYILACLSLSGCFHLGPDRLEQDQIGYSQALGDSENQQTLLNVVRLRYADTPSFLQTTQIISSYQLQQNISGGLQTFPGASTDAGNYVTAGASAQFQQSPTFTLQPIIGEQFADSFIRPLTPAELMPLIESGTPVDVLFRLGVQSVNNLQNARALGGNGSQGSPGFFLLVHDLRVLQMAGLLDASQSREEAEKISETNAVPKVYLEIGKTTDPNLAATAAELRQLLGLKQDATGAEVVYGVGTGGGGQISIVTRPMLSILNQLAIQIDVPAADIAAGETMPSVGSIGIEHRPVVIVHAGSKAPHHAFVAIKYHKTWFSISDDDFDSKIAFSIVQILLALTQTSNASGAVITIPAG